jgi:hypothetical protein
VAVIGGLRPMSPVYFKRATTESVIASGFARSALGSQPSAMRVSSAAGFSCKPMSTAPLDGPGGSVVGSAGFSGNCRLRWRPQSGRGGKPVRCRPCRELPYPPRANLIAGNRAVLGRLKAEPELRLCQSAAPARPRPPSSVLHRAAAGPARSYGVSKRRNRSRTALSIEAMAFPYLMASSAISSVVVFLG